MPTITATIIGSDTFTWEQGKALNLQLLDDNGDAVVAKNCMADNQERITIASDCSAITVHRLGESTFTVMGENNATAKVSVNGIAPTSPLVVNGSGGEEAHRVVSKDGHVLTWGSNSRQQLGVADVEDIDFLQYPEPVVLDNGEKLDNIAQVASSSSSAYALTKDGQVYGWGSGVSDVVVGNNVNSVLTPKLVQDTTGRQSLMNIVQLATEKFYTGKTGALALTDDKKVLQWLSGDKTYADYVVDANGNPITDIQAIALNGSQAYAVNKAGEVLQWELDPNNDSFPLSKIKDQEGNVISNVRKIVTTSTHTLALTKDGQVYAWNDTFNSNSNKEALGDIALKDVDLTNRQFANLVKLGGQPLDNIKDIAVGSGTSYALTQSGNVYAWGTGSGGQLGDGINKPLGNGTYTPSLVVSETGTGKLSNVAAITGAEWGALAYKTDGTLVGWGSSFNGMLTQDEGGELDLRYPVVIQASKGVPLTIGKPNQFTMVN